MARTILLKGKPTQTTEQDDQFLAQINKNNQTHVVNEQELQTLILKANEIHKRHFDDKVWMERSIFTNWTCGIADCKYCYLSTKPKLDRTAVRSPESILAEALICKAMGWKVGYITGGLRVEKTEYMIDLLQKLSIVLEHKTMMNYGPYTKQEVDAFAPFVSGMGCAIESFDEKLHAYICPSKPLSSLLKFLGHVKEKKLESFITIILGIGEKMSDIDEVIKKVEEYNITKVQLCFLKAQEQTVFDNTPAPDIKYMAWWVSRLRIAHPNLIIKIALVKDRIDDLHILLNAGVNSITRYMIFDDFAGELAVKLQKECELAGRKLQGNFTYLPQLDMSKLVNDLPALEPELKRKILIKANQYYARLVKLKEKKGTKNTQENDAD
ncbi:MAG TPA: radical SAM protein [Acidobacteriota bacterium]|nr:radical SAM protein [Acidobacteriota bacterium]